MSGRGEDAGHVVLVADDDGDILEYVKLRLELAGYGVLTASTGEEALTLALEHRPDLAVLDLVMPKMSGMELIRRIREEPSVSAMPLIVLSAHVGQWDVERALEAGADYYLSKPFTDPADLLAQVEEALKQARG
jgi:DNA-binding response OmpR family regulator